MLLDVHMRDGGGLAIVRESAARHSETRFLALSVSDSPEDVIKLVRAGARGSVTKNVSAAEHAEAITRVAAGEVVLLPASPASCLMRSRAPRRGLATRSSISSPRASRRGSSTSLAVYLYKEIALTLGVSTRTIETHASAVLRKLHLANCHQLARWTNQRRLVDERRFKLGQGRRIACPLSARSRPSPGATRRQG